MTVYLLYLQYQTTLLIIFCLVRDKVQQFYKVVVLWRGRMLQCRVLAWDWGNLDSSA